MIWKIIKYSHNTIFENSRKRFKSEINFVIFFRRMEKTF